MKPTTPHDPKDDAFDELMAAALHGDLTPEERAQFDFRLASDPAAQAAYQEAQAMHDLLEKTHISAQPDAAFEQRMVSGVRRKMQTETPTETAWESLLVLWKMIEGALAGHSIWTYGGVCSLLLVVVLGAVFYEGSQVKSVTTMMSVPFAMTDALVKSPENTRQQKVQSSNDTQRFASLDREKARTKDEPQSNPSNQFPTNRLERIDDLKQSFAKKAERDLSVAEGATRMDMAAPAGTTMTSIPPVTMNAPTAPITALAAERDQAQQPIAQSAMAASSPAADSSTVTLYTGKHKTTQSVNPPDAAPAPAQVDTRKLIRNGQLDLEVKSFQSAMDQITALTKTAGGYVDTSNSQKGGNGKLQGTVVIKVLPQNLDEVLLKLRDVGQVQNQSVSTDDVTKDYFDTQARLTNSQRMETQLQELLKHVNGKVSDLLEVERELGRVRGDIEQMQGQLKLYDFQVQYATVTIQVREADLNQAAAYLLKEQDDFALFSTDVEGTFQKAKAAADSFKAQVLTANLNHNSGSDVSAELMVMVAPDQIDAFLAQVRGLGRVANFTRQTQRVAKDGGDSSQPADETRTDKDKVQVHLAIRADDESRKQVALTVVAKAVDDALDQAKTAALANPGVEILSSALNKTPNGQSTAQLSVRVPGKAYATVIAAFQALGCASSLSIQRNDDSGPGANGDDAPVIISLSLTDDDTPLQVTDLSVRADDVDAGSQQIKKEAAAAGVEVKASSFARQPDGTEIAQMSFRLPMGTYAAFVEKVTALGKVESLSVQRDDRPDQTVADDAAPVEIDLELHNQRDLVPEENGLWTTLRQTFGEGAAALFASVKTIGVLAAFILPWLVALVLLAWVGRRIYVWRRKN